MKDGLADALSKLLIVNLHANFRTFQAYGLQKNIEKYIERLHRELNGTM